MNEEISDAIIAGIGSDDEAWSQAVSIVENLKSAGYVISRQAPCNHPHLGLATTKQLLDEISTRIEMHALGGLEDRLPP